MRGYLPGDPQLNQELDSSEPDKKKAPVKTDAVKKGNDTPVFREHVIDCPVCHKKFTSDTIKSGSLIAGDYDLDLRPKFKNADITLYKVLKCPHCGYSNHEKFFNDITNGEAGLIQNRMITEQKGTVIRFADRNYENTYPLYRSALSFAMIGGIKQSRRAYIALYTAWLLRGWREEKEKSGEIVKGEDVMGAYMERKLMKFAMENFRIARGTESFPICGLEMGTFDYLLASLFYLNGELDDAGRYLNNARKAYGIPAYVQSKVMDLTNLIRKRME
ncbi:MAG: DUF2225 domain-containing protein [Lachnospiraceae bacterium]|nr:DUF2225 domain-containing protein [Lachnospiraceae bacterium]